MSSALEERDTDWAPEEVDEKNVGDISGPTVGSKPLWMTREFIAFVEEEVRRILKLFIDDDAYIARILNPKTLPIFSLVWIHILYDATHNYENLENFGDAAWSAVLVGILQSWFPGRDESFITETKNFFVSKAIFSGYADGLGLMKLLKLDPKHREKLDEEKLKTDIFEAFVGALTTAGAMMYMDGDVTYVSRSLGFPLCEKFVLYILKRFHDGQLNGAYPAKTTVFELLKTFYPNIQKGMIARLKTVFNTTSGFVFSLSKDNILEVRDKLTAAGIVLDLVNVVPIKITKSEDETVSAFFGRIQSALEIYGITRENRMIEKLQQAIKLSKLSKSELKLMDRIGRAANIVFRIMETGTKEVEAGTESKKKIYRLIGLHKTGWSVNLNISPNLSDLIKNWIKTIKIDNDLEMFIFPIYSNGVETNLGVYSMDKNAQLISTHDRGRKSVDIFDDLRRQSDI